MVDYASTHAQAKKVAPPKSYEGARMRPPRPTPERLTSAHHRRCGQDVPPTGGDSSHRRHATSIVFLLASV
jgi:hypothetical protein